jgi:hypothetical protein
LHWPRDVEPPARALHQKMPTSASPPSGVGASGREASDRRELASRLVAPKSTTTARRKIGC